MDMINKKKQIKEYIWKLIAVASGLLQRMVGGHVTPPRITIANEKIIQRHMQAVLIAAFLWREKEAFGTNRYVKVEDFLEPIESVAPSGSLECGSDRLRAFAESKPEAVVR